mmetsp:Transcript_10944/g.16837  ORF Transcript_10944/g.16837 Transcript_10944/m.16837 type:complete len:410 (+) Transcript_10944:242-1471(+)
MKLQRPFDKHGSNNNNKRNQFVMFIIAAVFIIAVAVACSQLSSIGRTSRTTTMEQKDPVTRTILDDHPNATVISRPLYPPGTKNKPTKFLLGIFSVDSEEEAKRRKLMRDTMLDRSTLPDPSKLCSLTEFVANLEIQTTCQIIYTFVLGGNPQGDDFWSSSILYDDDRDALAPVSVLTSPELLENEKDITFLNIKENMDQGKSVTWLDFASVDGIIPSIDYIGKADTDTLINMVSLLAIVDRRLPPAVEDTTMSLYGGDFVFPSPPYKPFMQGGFYFVSRPLARCVSAEAADQQKFHGPEDQRTAWMVLKCPRVEWLMCPNTNLFYHFVKRNDAWMYYFAEIKEHRPPVEDICRPKAILQDDMFLKRFADRNLYYGMGRKDEKSALRQSNHMFQFESLDLDSLDLAYEA